MIEEKRNRILAAWFDETKTARQIALEENVHESQIANVWHCAKRRGTLPSGYRRLQRPGNGNFGRKLGVKKGLLPGDLSTIPFDEPITTGRKDKLLDALRREHGRDELRKTDDLTEKLESLRQRMMQSNKRLSWEDCAA